MNEQAEQIKIMLLEDDAALSMGLEYALQSEGFAVKAAPNIKKAGEIIFLEQYDPDLIILDVMLPDGTGYDFCSQIVKYRKEQNKLAWPVIFLSACDSEANIVMGLDGGGDDYITKPFRIRELVSRVKAVLRRKGNTKKTEAVLRYGSLTVDLHSYRVWYNNDEIQLTVMEFKLLSVLMRNQGRILSRQILLQSLWDDRGSYIDDNTLSVHISHLRDKLEKEAESPLLIHTIRGVGYRFGSNED